MHISIGICTHNEGPYVKSLLNKLVAFIQQIERMTTDTFEIVVVDDFSDEDTANILYNFAKSDAPAIVVQHALNNDFATHKNFLNSKCTGEWILNLDADEWLPDDVLFNLSSIIEANPEVEAYWLPRINTVDGLTQAHVSKWGWIITRLDGFRTATMRENLSEAEYNLLVGHQLIISEQDGLVVYDKPIIQFPDPQMRLYKNVSTIQWEGKVHERLTGFKNFSMLPYDPEYAIRHEKEIKRQEQQNSYYETINR